MKLKSTLSEMLVSFCICTTFICLLQGVLGMIFFPDIKMGYECFFSPPVFGFFSSLLGLVEFSKKELSLRQVVIRRIVHLVLIEGMVFGINLLVGAPMTLPMVILLALGIALIYICVHVVLWIDEVRYAQTFNEQLKAFQAKEEEGALQA